MDDSSQLDKAQAQLMTIYSQALAKMEAGDVTVWEIDKKDCAANGTDRNSPEEEVLIWMLTNWMYGNGNKRYKGRLPYIKKPKGMTFDPTQFRKIDLIYFASPQTALSRSQELGGHDGT